MQKGILFFADRLPPLTGGMEVHAYYFIKHFTSHQRFPLVGVITKNNAGIDCVVSEQGENVLVDLKELADLFDPAFVFFNSGRWIEELGQIRKFFPQVPFLYRTGGNEILKAPLINKQILSHSLRQLYWTSNINNLIDLLITNSIYTEKRLRKLGITCPFERCVGGVNVSALQSSTTPREKQLTIFCAARFVPYKNHSLLLSVIHQLVLRGYDLHVRLAGDGPLLDKLQEQVYKNDLTSVVEFLGVLDNKATCQEIACANIYMQLSTDYLTEVPGGTYVHAEGMGRAILEAISAGTFVIAGRSGALDEIVTTERGLLIELDDLEHIISKIEPIFKHPLIRLPFLDDFSWTKIFNRYEEMLEDLDESTASYRKMRPR